MLHVLYLAVNLVWQAGDFPARVAIVGPTASGKSAVALEVARRVPIEIISADSMQVYRRMDIGTAKPTAGEQASVPIHLIDVVDPDEPWTLSDFQRDGTAHCTAAWDRGCLPVIVGGTGLYTRALTEDLMIPKAAPNEELRERWRKFAEENGTESLYSKVRGIDPVAAARIHVNDVKRLIRVLEVYETQGRRISDLHAENRATAKPYEILIFGLNYADRDALYKRINGRVEQMMAAGFAGEVKALLSSGYSRDLISMQSLGYRHLSLVLAGEMEMADAVDLLKRDTRHFARRQLVWFRRDAGIRWIEMDERTPSEAADIICAEIKDAARQPKGMSEYAEANSNESTRHVP